MPTLAELWLPILLASVIVFVASFLAWMLLPHHRADWRGLPDEEGLIRALRELDVPPGQYMFPFCDPKRMEKAEMKRRWEAGPHGTLNLWPARPNMGRNLLLTFVFYLGVSLMVGYLTSAAVGAGASYAHVFRVAGTAAVMAYAFGAIPNAIWFGKPLRNVLTDVADGVVYGMLTAGAFAGFWPDAAETVARLP